MMLIYVLVLSCIMALAHVNMLVCIMVQAYVNVLAHVMVISVSPCYGVSPYQGQKCATKIFGLEDRPTSFPKIQ